jgi:hypothetical protein
MNERVKAVLEGILERFKAGDIPQAIAYTLNPIPDIPSSRWSFMNRLIMNLSGTTDARGIRQWNQAGRTIKKGSKAIYILVPWIVGKIKHPGDILEDDALQNPEIRIVKGFMAKPVFRVEDTEGEPLDYPPLIIPDLPLMDRAREWGITVTAIPGFNKAYGAYIPKTKEILLATQEETVFFHELSHAAYERAIKELEPGQLWDQEVSAELCAQALCHLVGRAPQETLGNSYRYIDHYAKQIGITPLIACLQVMSSVERMLKCLLEKDMQKAVKQENFHWKGEAA